MNNDQSKVVVIKRYTDSNEAYIDAELLRSHGIECSVDGAIGGSVLPFIQGQVSLIVAAVEAKEAARIVPGSQIEGDDE